MTNDSIDDGNDDDVDNDDDDDASLCEIPPTSSKLSRVEWWWEWRSGNQMSDHYNYTDTHTHDYWVEEEDDDVITHTILRGFLNWL